MTKDEMRFIRREFINDCLHLGFRNIVQIMAIVRIREIARFGHELGLC